MHIDPFLGHDKLERITVTLDGNRPVRVDDVSSATAASGVTYQLAMAGEPAERIDFDGGFITLPDGGYHFHVRDHLGSTRAVVSLSGALERTLDYGPYGESLGTDWAATSAPAARKLFIGKEKLASDDTELYDFGARRYDPALPRWTSADPLAGKYPGLSPYAYCVGNPIRIVDPVGAYLKINDLDTIMAIYHGMERGEHLFLRFQNGFVDPFSFDPHSEDFFIQYLYELASNDTYTIELSTNNSFQHKTENGIENKDFESTPMDVSDYDIDDSFCEYLKELGLPFGRTVQGNLGRAIFPVKSKSQSIDSHIHIVINAKGRLNHRTIGLAHEFGHVLLFLRGKPYQHPNPEADSFIYGRATMMSKRLGYDY